MAQGLWHKDYGTDGRAGRCRIASGSQTDLLQRLPDKGQVGIDVMPGRYLDKLHLVRISTGIVSAGSNGYDLILRAMNDGDGGWRWWWRLVETAVYLQIIAQGHRPIESVMKYLPYPIGLPLVQLQPHPLPGKISQGGREQQQVGHPAIPLVTAKAVGIIQPHQAPHRATNEANIT